MIQQRMFPGAVESSRNVATGEFGIKGEASEGVEPSSRDISNWFQSLGERQAVESNLIWSEPTPIEVVSTLFCPFPVRAAQREASGIVPPE